MKSITERIIELKKKSPPPPPPSFMERLNLFLAKTAFALSIVFFIIVLVRGLLKI